MHSLYELMQSIFDGSLLYCGVNVLAITILVSTCLAGVFVVCFAMEAVRSRRSSPERESLLPLDDVTPDPPESRRSP